MHVDDFLWGGTEQFESKVINQIRKNFKIGEQSNIAFKYIGLSMKQNKNDVTIDQNLYAKSIKPINITKSRAMKKEDYCNKDEIEQLRSLVGQLGWLSSNSRPDISFDVLELSCNLNHPQVQDLLKANKCLMKVKNCDSFIKFPNLGNLEKCELVVG